MTAASEYGQRAQRLTGRETGRIEMLRFAVRTAARLVLAPFFSLRVEGSENLPAGQGFILLPKHQRWVDVPLVALACARPLYFVAKEELFHPVPVGRFISGLGGIPLNRSRPLQSRRSLRMIDSLFGLGEGIVVFPEGTYYPGRVGPGRPGMIRFICSRCNVPFVPAGIRYQAGRWRTDVTVVFGEPIIPEGDGDIRVLVDMVMERISVLSGLPRAPA